MKNQKYWTLVKKSLFVAGFFGVSANAMAADCFSSKPLGALVVTSKFGKRLHPSLGVVKPHMGIDFQARTPLPIFAVDGGDVVMRGFASSGGNMIQLQTDKGMRIKYMHLSQINADLHTRVKSGEMIGKTGETGEHIKGPHLHFETFTNTGANVDPSQFICDASVTPADPKDEPPMSPEMAAANAVKNVNGVMVNPNAVKATVFPSMDGMALRDFLYSETHKRFMNPQWLKEMANPGAMKNENPKTAADTQPVVYDKTYLYTELNIMLALKNLMALEKREQKESMEARSAAILSTDAKNYSEKIMSMTRGKVGP